MTTKFLPSLLLIFALASCSTAYRTTQTPDDVYFSPTKDGIYVTTNNTNETIYNVPVYNDGVMYDVPMSPRDYRMYRRYGQYPYGYSYPYGYATSPVYINPKTGSAPKTYKPRIFSLDSYRKPVPATATAVDPKTGRTITPVQPMRVNTNNMRTRRIFAPALPSTGSRTNPMRSIDNGSSRRTTSPGFDSSPSNNNVSRPSSPNNAPTTAPVRKVGKN